MKVEAFVPDWPGPKQHAKEVVDIISPYCQVTIIDEPDAYFNRQWQIAREQFTGDVLLWVMADVVPPSNFGEMFSEMKRVMARGDVGWYAPDISWTCFIYNTQDLQLVEVGIYETPNTDSLCFAIRGDVVRAMPFIDPQICYMWGMDFTAISTARLMGLKTVRDYRFKASHPNSTGYDIPKASREMAALWATYSPEQRSEIDRLLAEDTYLKKRARDESRG